MGQPIHVKPEEKSDDKKYTQNVIKEKCFKYVESSIKESESEAKRFLHEGNACCCSEKYKDAEEYYLKAYDSAMRSKEDGLIWDSLQRIGCVLGRQEKYEKSHEKFKESLKYAIDKNRLFTTYFNLGISDINLENEKEAISYFEKAIRTNPEDVGAYFYKAVAHINRRDFDKAEDGLKKVIQINPKHAKAHSYLADILFYIGKRSEEAKSEAEIALKLFNEQRNVEMVNHCEELLEKL